jgi:hypothetical protein
MKGNTMEQDLFEKAIEGYVTKVDGPLPYKFTKSIRYRTIEITDYVAPKVSNARKVRPSQGRALRTPDGVFNSVPECAAYYNRSNQWVYIRIQTGEFTKI